MKVQEFIIHCSATKEGLDFKAIDIDRWHKQRGWKGIGYHYVIDIDGTIEKGREDTENGAHTIDHNSKALGICYIGGLDKDGKAKDTRTTQLKAAMYTLIMNLHSKYPNATVHGHREFNATGCPSFDVQEEWADFNKEIAEKAN